LRPALAGLQKANAGRYDIIFWSEFATCLQYQNVEKTANVKKTEIYVFLRPRHVHAVPCTHVHTLGQERISVRMHIARFAETAPINPGSRSIWRKTAIITPHTHTQSHAHTCAHIHTITYHCTHTLIHASEVCSKFVCLAPQEHYCTHAYKRLKGSLKGHSKSISSKQPISTTART